MIDFMLEDTGVPSGSFDDPRCALMIETGDAHFPCAGHQGGESWQAQAAFEVCRSRLSKPYNCRVHNDVKWDLSSTAFHQVRFAKRLLILSLIFDHGELQRFSNLRCGKSHSRSIAKGLPHVSNQVLDR